MAATKSCPIVLRERGGVLQILAFEHPLAGRQLVKGSIEPGESAADAAVRELREEAGLQATAFEHLGDWHSKHDGQIWSFQLCRLLDEPGDAWTHRCLDDGGHDFAFFWHPLHVSPSQGWHLLFVQALIFVRDTLGTRVA